MKTTAPDDSTVPLSDDEERQAALDRLSQQAFESGLYDRNEMPAGGTDE
jgi:hypothetical protein